MARLLAKTRRRPISIYNPDQTPENQKAKATVEAEENFEFSFNRADWKVDIEIYSFVSTRFLLILSIDVCSIYHNRSNETYWYNELVSASAQFLRRPKWESSLNVHKGTRRVEHIRPLASPSTSRRSSVQGDSDRHIEVRNSSFGLLARATLSKDDVLARR